MDKKFVLKNKKQVAHFNGVLLVNKDRDCTSHDIVDEVRHLLKQRTVGHAGTLDPQARGLLVILCGMATKLSPYFLNNDKRYQLTLQFGLETDTFDLQGKVLKSQEVSLKKEVIEELLKAECRDLEIPVPLFSAVKVKGKKLYSYGFSGKGEEVKPPVKKMSFWDLTIHKITNNSATLSVTCAKGSYIRSWVQYLGQKIGTGACLTHLERTLSGIFCVQHSQTINEIKKKLDNNFPKTEDDLKALLGESFLFPSKALAQFPPVSLTVKNARMLLQGKIPLYILTACQSQQIEVNKTGQAQILKAVNGEKLVALLELNPFKRLKILRNFPGHIL